MKTHSSRVLQLKEKYSHKNNYSSSDDKILNSDINHHISEPKQVINHQDIEVKISLFNPTTEKKRKPQKDRKKRVAHNFKALP